MATLHLEIVTQERRLYTGDVDMVVAPGSDGEMGILPHHASLLTTLKEGVLKVKHDGREDLFSIGGGFLEVQPDRVIVLADAAERAEEIDLARAEEARRRAEELLKERPAGVDIEKALTSLRRAQIRVAVAQKRGGRRADVSQARPSGDSQE
jgi:F-type H+-transporting ATPase subunit epsilon